MDAPPTIFTKTDEGYIAYQVAGEGPDVLFTTSPMHNIDVMWDHPSIARFFERITRYARLIVYNPRGTGVSSPLPAGSSLERWMDDARRILDAVGSDRAAIIGDTEGGPTAMMFGASYPERTSALVLVNTFARFVRADEYPWGIPEASVASLVGSFEAMYGRGDMAYVLAPSVADDARFRHWLGRYERLSMPGPGAAASGYQAYLLNLDLRPIVSTIRVPTLVVHRADNQFVRVGHGRYLAEAIPGARYVELPGGDALYYAGNADELADEVQAFLTGVRGEIDVDRVLATVLFTDLVASTARAAELGDRRWKEVLDAHDRITARHLDQFRGRLVKTTGDGILATFDGPARAIRCARSVADELRRSHGVDIRSGLHAGEVELRGSDVGGIGVHIAARVMGEAGPGEVIVSSTVKDLVVGSGIEFDDRGEHALKGVPGEWRLYAVRS